MHEKFGVILSKQEMKKHNLCLRTN